MKELIILGTGQSWKDCPFDAELWATSSVFSLLGIDYKKIHKVFAFDEYESVKKDIEIAKENLIPFVSAKDYATEKYPLEEITREFGICYFRNTITYMLAYAIYKGYEKLRLYGIDQGPQWDYVTNKPYVFYWLGVATGKGIKVELAKTSTLTQPMADEIRRYIEILQKKARDIRVGLASGRYRI